MITDRRFLVDVGMQGLSMPVKVPSRSVSEGQSTIADISVSARIRHEFEARWIDTFAHILHRHRDHISAASLIDHVGEYIEALQASVVTVTLDFPFFYEKEAPVSREKCLVRYQCGYTVKANSIAGRPRAILRVDVPVLTTHPASTSQGELASILQGEGGAFTQSSMITVEVEPLRDVFPEDLVDLVEHHALVPLYSYLTAEDQAYLIRQAYTGHRSSVVVVDNVRDELARHRGIAWYSVVSVDRGMFHSYATMVATEKSMWIPFEGYEADEV
ncbi:MAG: GTP cyclohydrolase, FolE2/MptA family [Thermoleophilia bacterium]|jgi:GTP cyclohydrolase I